MSLQQTFRLSTVAKRDGHSTIIAPSNSKQREKELEADHHQRRETAVS